MRTETPNYDQINSIEIKNLFSKVDLDKKEIKNNSLFFNYNHFSAVTEGVKMIQSHENISKQTGRNLYCCYLSSCSVPMCVSECVNRVHDGNVDMTYLNDYRQSFEATSFVSSVVVSYRGDQFFFIWMVS